MKRLVSFLVISTLITLASCSDNPVDGGPGLTLSNPDSTASSYFQQMGDAMQNISGMSADEVRNVRFDDIRNGFTTVLQSDPGNGIAHLGLAILEILELNYDTDIWDLIDTISNSSGMASQPVNRHRTLIGRQFELMVEVPLAMGMMQANAFPDVTLNTFQTMIETKVIPALTRSANHLTAAEGDTDARLRILVDPGLNEYIAIDLGEIYIFDASVQALKAIFNMLVARDLDLVGPDGTYGYIDQIDYLNSSSSWCPFGEIVPGTPYDDIYLLSNEGEVDGMVDSIMVAVAYYNMASRPGYLALRHGGQPLADARAAFVGTADKLAASANFIRNVRQNETEENLVKLADLTGMDSDLPPNNGANFSQNFNTIEDVLTFVKDLLNGPVTFTESVGPNHILFQFQLNVSAWFLNPVGTLKSLLPYHQWTLPSGRWLQCDVVLVYPYYLGGGTWQGNVDFGQGCEFVTVPNVGVVNYYEKRCGMPSMSSIIQFLNGPAGQPIDPKVEGLPYFPDYTFGGLFPDMTRARWKTVLGLP